MFHLLLCPLRAPCDILSGSDERGEGGGTECRVRLSLSALARWEERGARPRCASVIGDEERDPGEKQQRGCRSCENNGSTRHHAISAHSLLVLVVVPHVPCAYWHTAHTGAPNAHAGAPNARLHFAHACRLAHAPCVQCVHASIDAYARAHSLGSRRYQSACAGWWTWSAHTAGSSKCRSRFPRNPTQMSGALGTWCTDILCFSS